MQGHIFWGNSVMNINTTDLSDLAAVEALCQVAREWLLNRGLDAYQIYHETRETAASRYDQLPIWIKGQPRNELEESGPFARRILATLLVSTDGEVQEWTETAIRKVDESKAHVLDPLTLGIGGLILIGAILAARVKKIGAVEFYEGIPENLAAVLKAGASVVPPSQ